MGIYWWGLFLDETLLECVKRETCEETGIILKNDDIKYCKLYDDPSIIIAYPDGNIIRSMMALYEVTLKTMPNLQCSEESVDLRFFSKEELKNIKIVETHTPILEDYFPNIYLPDEMVYIFLKYIIENKFKYEYRSSWKCNWLKNA